MKRPIGAFTWPTIVLIYVLTFLAVPEASADWEASTQVDRMTDKATKLAIVKNQQGQQFFIARRDEVGKKGNKYSLVVSYFLLRENDINGIDARGTILVRVDKNAPQVLYVPGMTDQQVTARGANNLLISVTDPPKECGNDLLYQLARGSELVVEYHSLSKGVQYAEFRLGGGEKVIGEAVSLDLTSRQQEDFCRAKDAALRACIGRIKPGKPSNCEAEVKLCAGQTDTAENFTACAPRYLK